MIAPQHKFIPHSYIQKRLSVFSEYADEKKKRKKKKLILFVNLKQIHLLNGSINFMPLFFTSILKNIILIFELQFSATFVMMT